MYLIKNYMLNEIRNPRTEKRNSLKNIWSWTSLWHSGWESTYQCRGRRFNPWSGKIPHATEPLNLCATTAEPACWTTEARVLGACALQQEKPQKWEAWASEWRVAPFIATRESPRKAMKTQCSQKKQISNTIIIIFKELVIGKCEDGETKNSCWAGELETIYTRILPQSRITELPVPWQIQIKTWHSFLNCFYRKQTSTSPPDENSWPQEHRP